MIANQIRDDGICTTCNVNANEKHIVECQTCNTKFHADCATNLPFCNRAFLREFMKLKKDTCFHFTCNHCRTSRENVEAASTKQTLSDVVESVAALTKEVKELKKELRERSAPQTVKPNIPDASPTTATTELQQPWRKVEEGIRKVKKVKKGITLCVKSDGGESVNLGKVKEIVATNGVQVTKASINKRNGDLYIDLPTKENRDKLVPLLDQADIPGNRVINVKQKCPTISLRNVSDYVDEDDFITKIKAQNNGLSEKIEGGSEFSVVFTRKNRRSEDDENEPSKVLVVLRVSNDIRDILKLNNDHIFFGTNSYRVIDRFYVKRCAKCHRYGHYHAECTYTPCCGFCLDKNHNSENCPVRQVKDHSKFKCVNCKDKNKLYDGHSSHYSKCPIYIETQKKMMLNIPYYTKNQE